MGQTEGSKLKKRMEWMDDRISAMKHKVGELWDRPQELERFYRTVLSDLEKIADSGSHVLDSSHSLELDDYCIALSNNLRSWRNSELLPRL